jgi:predicted GNAT family acetyltransferase
MTFVPSHPDFEYPDEAGYPDGTGTLTQDQVVLIDEVAARQSAPAHLYFENDEKTGTFEALIGDTEVGNLPYNVAGDRLVLLATSVFPEFRNQGIATELIRHVLDEVRAQGKTVTIFCPIVRTFIEHNPEYADLVDPEHPGVTRTH